MSSPPPICLILAFVTISMVLGSCCCADSVNVCCYSTNPDKYEPKCYQCNEMVYRNALLACINATDLPKNISFDQASCIEKNCKVEPPTLATKTTSERFTQFSGLLDAINQLLNSITGGRSRRSVADNRVEPNPRVAKKFTTTAQEGIKVVAFGDPDYFFN